AYIVISVVFLLSSFCLSFICCLPCFFFFFFTDPSPTEIYSLSLHDALPISGPVLTSIPRRLQRTRGGSLEERVKLRLPLLNRCRSEEHTSELQSRFDLVCRLLLEKKKKKNKSRAEEQKNT